MQFRKHVRALAVLPVWALAFASLAAGRTPSLAPGPDKSGVGPAAVSLPSGPGSIGGFGAQYDWRMAGNKGAWRYEVSIAGPSGPAELSPDLSAIYGSDLGAGRLGLGWRLNLPYVERDTVERLPLYKDADEWSRTVFPAAEETFRTDSGDRLVRDGTGDYFAEDEREFVRYRRRGDGWIALFPDGDRLYLGNDARSQLRGGPNSERVFRWLPNRLVDPHGNEIRFRYRENDDAQTAGAVRARRLDRIEYGAGAPPRTASYIIAFGYEERPDVLIDGRPGFVVENAWRLATVDVRVRDGAGERMIRRYRFEYAPATRVNGVSLVSSVTEIGRDGRTALPATKFGYTGQEASSVAALDVASAVVETELAGIGSVSSSAVEFADLDADSLPDLLITPVRGDTRHRVALNLGVMRPEGEGAAILRFARPQIVGGDRQSKRVTLAAGDQDAALADFNGDGRVDLGYRSGAGGRDSIYYFPGDGMASWGERRRLEGAGYAPYRYPPQQFPGQRSRVRQADLDGDRRIDLVRSAPDGRRLTVWFCLETGGYSRGVAWPCPEEGCDFADPRLMLAEATGDGLPDLVRIRSRAVDAAPGLGFGRFGAYRSLPYPNGDMLPPDTRARFVDVTGDGLGDLVVGPESGGDMRISVNRGGTALGPWIVLAGAPRPLSARAKERWVDVTGDGAVDYVLMDDTGGAPAIRILDVPAALGLDSKPNLMSRVDNGRGQVVTVAYSSAAAQMAAARAAAAPWKTATPVPVTVVSVVAERVYPHPDTTRVEYRYRDGIYAKDTREHRGFETVVTTEIGQEGEHPSLVTETLYERGDDHKALKGLPRRERLMDGNRRVLEERATVWSRPPRPLRFRGREAVSRFAHPRRSFTRIFGPRPDDAAVIEERYSYDDAGNRTRHEELGRVTAPGTPAEPASRRVRIVEPIIDEERWMLRAPRRERLVDHTGSVQDERRYFYDDETFDPERSGHIGRGLLTMVQRRVRLSGGEVGVSNGSEWVVGERHRYDHYGNRVLTLGPLASLGADGGLSPAPGNATVFEIDPVMKNRPIRETVIVNDLVRLDHRFEYDPDFGSIAAYTGPSGYRTAYGYDALGRLRSITYPGDQPDRPSVWYRYRAGFEAAEDGRASWIDTLLLDEPEAVAGGDSAYYLSRLFLDGRGRALYTKTEGAVGPDGENGAAMFGIVRLSTRGKPVRALSPCVTTERTHPFAWENPFDPDWVCDWRYDSRWHRRGFTNAPQTKRRYDPRSREVATIAPDGAMRRTWYGPLERRLEDENVTAGLSGSPLTYRYDGLGRLSAIVEEPRLDDDGAPTPERRAWLTTFAYDAADRLTGIVNAEGGRRTVVYDGLGRVTRLSDPAFGSHLFEYDSASNLVVATDAERRKARYTYDGADRLLSETHSREDGDETIRVDYVYDTSPNGQGRLGVVRDAAGTLHLEYDLRGRVTSRQRQFDPIFGGGVYRASYRYDALDRLTERVYPDGDRATFHYNERNLPKAIEIDSVGDVVADVSYGPDGQPIHILLGNETRRRHAYDLRGRLVRIELSNASGDGLLFEETLRFDSASNIVVRTRRSESEPPRVRREEFEYDDLHRLISASYDPPMEDGVSRIAYRFDRTGGLLSALAEHARSDSSMSWPAYVELSAPIVRDATGRARRIDDISFDWNTEGRLKTVVSPAGRVTNVYDYAGSRVWRHEVLDRAERAEESDDVSISLFPWSDYEEVDGRGVKMVDFSGTRIARVDTITNGGGPRAPPSIIYFHTDHLGSPILAVDEDQKVIGEQLFHPFGAIARRHGIDVSRGFTGAQREEEFGLTAFDARYLHEATGRFLSPDPVLLHVSKPPSSPQALNPYAYSLNRPLTYIDPDGRWPLPIIYAAKEGATGVAIGYSVAKATDSPYGWKDAIRDFGIGVISVGIISKLRHFPKMSKGIARAIGKDRAIRRQLRSMDLKLPKQINNKWTKHMEEFPELRNSDEYATAMSKFFKNPAKKTFIKRRPNGDILLYDLKTNTFGAIDRSGKVRTMFRPEKKWEYWLDQK